LPFSEGIIMIKTSLKLILAIPLVFGGPLFKSSFADCPVEMDLYHFRNYVTKITKFDIGMEILNHFKSRISLSPVRMGVFDTGFYPNRQLVAELVHDDYACTFPVPSPQELEPLTESEQKHCHKCMHGTKVAGIISAINRDGHSNGFVSLLQDGTAPGLVRVSMRSHGAIRGERLDFRDFRNSIERMAQLLDDGATVINMSMTYLMSPGAFEDIERSKRWWIEFTRAHPETLFLISSGNEGRDEIYPEELPAGTGIILDNVLVVGGMELNEASNTIVRREASNHGPMVEIYGPSNKIAVVQNDDHLFGNGTSFAAPIVSSLAAIIKSINPGLNGNGIKRRILETANRQTPGIPVIDFAKAIMVSLQARNDLPPALRSLFNEVRRNLPATAGDILTRICERNSLTAPVARELLPASSMPGNTMGSKRGRALTVGASSMQRTWDAESLSNVGMPGYIWDHASVGPLEIVNFTLTSNNLTYTNYSTILPLPRPIPPPTSIFYRAQSGRKIIRDCSYYEEPGQTMTLDLFTNDNVPYKRILFQEGTVEAQLVSCIVEPSPEHGITNRISMPLSAGDCARLGQNLSTATQSVNAPFAATFRNLHHYVMVDTLWNQVRELCKYFFDL
jgi:hypothetical protein